MYPELVTRTATGEVQTVKYQELIPMLLNELQRQRQDFQRELAELRALVGQNRGTEASTSATAEQTNVSFRGPTTLLQERSCSVILLRPLELLATSNKVLACCSQ